MKKKMKSMLSLLFVLVLLVQLGGAMASAGSGLVNGSEALAYEAYFPAPTAEDPNAYARLTDEAADAELLGGKTYSVVLGGQPLAQYFGTNTMSDLVYSDLVITPPDGYYVSELYLRGDAYAPSTPVSVKAEAAYPYGNLSDAAVLTLKHDKVYELQNGSYVFRDELISSPADTGYTLVIYFDEIEFGTSLTVSYSAVGYIEPDYGYTGDYFTVRSLSDDQVAAAHDQGLEFAGWLLRYDDTGAEIAVSAGSQIAPYGNCTLEAQWDTYVPEEPAYEEPVVEEPTYEEPTYEEPIYEEPTYEEPTYEEPTYEEPTYEEPTYEEPTYEEPTYEEPTYEEPTYEEPSYEEPANVEPTYEEPSYEQPTYEQPAANTSSDTTGEQPINDGPVAIGDDPYTAGPTTGNEENPYAGGPSGTAENPYAGGPADNQNLPTNGDSNVGPSSNNTIDNPGTATEVVIPGADGPIGSTTTPEPSQPVAQSYTVLDGHNSSWALNSSSGLSFRVGSDFRKFDSLEVDRAIVHESYYTVSSGTSGSTNIELSTSYLNGLTLGNHAITFNYTDGTATAAFYIDQAAQVEKIDLTVKVMDVEADYSGQNILGNGYEIVSGSMYPGDTLALTYKGGSVNVTSNGSTEVDTYALADADGNDASEKYNLTFLPGKVVVKPLAITLTARDYDRPANGNAFDFRTEYRYFNSYGALGGHTVSVDPYLSQNGYRVTSAVNQGSYDIMVNSITVRDANGNNVSGNYTCNDLNKKLATLTIASSSATEIPVTISVTNNIWTYDGKPHTVKDYQVTGLVDGDQVAVTFANNTITDAGEYHVIQSYRITNNGVAVSDKKYKVTLDDTVTVQKFTVTLTAESASKGYDGTALKNDNVRASALANSNHKIAVNFAVKDSSGNIIKNGAVNVGTYAKTITNVTIKDGNIDVTNNYDIRRVDGTLTITNSNGQVNSSIAPKTGDSNNIGLWIAILVASLLAVGAVAAYLILKKRGSKKKAAPKQRKSDRY